MSCISPTFNINDEKHSVFNIHYCSNITVEKPTSKFSDIYSYFGVCLPGSLVKGVSAESWPKGEFICK